MSSAKVVAIIKKLLHPEKIGHGGTLDPLAVGVLPIAMGEATKTVSYVMDGKKSYKFNMFFGEQRSTGDSEGEVVATSGKIPSRMELLDAINGFKGEILQTPHKFSAIRVDGKRAYDLAREGEVFELEARKVEVYSIKLLDFNDNIAVLTVDCSKGTYVRSLCEDIAEKCGSKAYVSYLERTACGKFNEKNKIPLDFLEKIVHSTEIAKYLIPLEDTLDDISGIALEEEETARLRHGQRIKLPDLEGCGEVLKVLHKGKLVALVEARGDVLHPIRVFNNQ